MVGKNPEEVIRVLNRRKEGKKDSHRVALVVEGGALRGVFGAGVLHSLAQAGYVNCFDVIAGTSSGALNIMYFLDNRLEVAESIYRENALDPKCFSLKNVFNGLDIMNTEWLVREWILKHKKYDEQYVHAHPTEIYVANADVETGLTRWFSSKKDIVPDFKEALVAGCATPLAFNKMYSIGTSKYSDGFIESALPIDKAFEEDCTHVVVVTTRHLGEKKKTPGLLQKTYESFRIRRFGEGYKDRFVNQSCRYNEARISAVRGGDNMETIVMAPQKKEDTVGIFAVRPESISRSFYRGKEIADKILSNSS